MIRYAVLAVLLIGVIPIFAQSPITFEINTKTLIPGQIVELTGTVDKSLINQPVAVEIRDSEGNVILIRSVTPDSEGNFSLKFKVPSTVKTGEIDITTNVESDGQTITESKSVVATVQPKQEEPKKEPIKPRCGSGTVEKDGMCVPDTATKKEQVKSDTSQGGGCLIATASYGTELAPQVQLLREFRDNTLSRTASGTAFMSGFNHFYYSFSPTIADLERENPTFKEAVKITITPMLYTVSLLSYFDIDSENEVLGYGIGIILLNIGMYFVIPAFVILKLKNRRYLNRISI